MRWPFGIRSRVTIAVILLVGLILAVLATAFLGGVEDTVATGAIAESERDLGEAERGANEVHSAFVDRLRLLAEEIEDHDDESPGRTAEEREEFDRRVVQEREEFEQQVAQQRDEYEQRVEAQRSEYEQQLADWEVERAAAEENDQPEPPEPPEPPELPEPPEPPEPPELADPAEALEPRDFGPLWDIGGPLAVYDVEGNEVGDNDAFGLLNGVGSNAIGSDAATATCRRSLAGVTCEADGEVGFGDVLETLERLVRESSDRDEAPGVVVGRVVTLSDQWLLVIVNERVDDVGAVVVDVDVISLGVIALIAAAIGAITWFALGRTLNPVKAMTVEVDHISDRNLDQRITVPHANDELQQLAHTMNRMLDRLLASRDRQRRFVSDASHELRSPITAVQATLEVAMAKPDDADWPEVADVVRQENSRLGSLVDGLLLLARLDENPADEVTMAVDLDEICLVEAERPRRVPVRVQVHAPARVQGSLSMLTRAVRNLIDNAAEHATTEVEVEVDVRADGEGEAALMAVVSVSDDGPGIAPEHRKVVFERFTRLDEARSRGSGGGAGLGLAIVAGVAEAHGGTVTAGTSASFGARFILSLPILP